MSRLESLSARDRHVLVFGIGAIVAIIGAGKGFPALRELSRQRLAAAREEIAELRAVRAAEAVHFAVRDSLTARTVRLSLLRKTLLLATTPQDGSAQLAEIVDTYAAEAGAQVSASFLRSDTSFSHGMAVVGVRVSLTTDVRGLVGVLHRIESSDREFAVRELAVGSGNPGAQSADAEKLSVDLFVEAAVLRADTAGTGQGTKRDNE